MLRRLLRTLHDQLAPRPPVPDLTHPLPFNHVHNGMPWNTSIPTHVNMPVYYKFGLWKSTNVDVRVIRDAQHATIHVDPEFIRELTNGFNDVISYTDFYDNIMTYGVPALGILITGLEIMRSKISDVHPSLVFNIIMYSIEVFLGLLALALTGWGKFMRDNNSQVGEEAYESKKSLGCRQ